MSTRTGPSPTAIPSPSGVAPAGTWLGLLPPPSLPGPPLPRPAFPPVRPAVHAPSHYFEFEHSIESIDYSMIPFALDGDGPSRGKLMLSNREEQVLQVVR